MCLILELVLCSAELRAQISEKGIPESFLLEEKQAVLLPAMKLDRISVASLLEEDQKFKIENRYGVVQLCDLDIKKSGVKTVIQDKGTIWRYQIESENARSLGLFFKKYKLPPNAKVFLYNASRSQVRGAFTANNSNNGKVLPVAEFPGNSMIIEYFEPVNPQFTGELVLGSVSQAYINLLKIAEDRIGINCEAGIDWKKEKSSVCLMTYHDVLNSYFCTGALMNNTKEDQVPYFLTANHCISTEEIANTLITYFNYENSTCTSTDAAFSQTLSGATFKAGSNYSDFSLLLLNEYPPDEYNPFYAGWDVTGINPRSAACIHHPDGNPKCIATANNTAFSYPEKIEWFSEDLRLISTTYPDSHWNVLFNQGLPEIGSSGSPLFDQNKRIVGQLHGGVNSVLLFGKLSLSWDYNSAVNEQLAHWLDPSGSNRKILDGIWKMPPKANFRAELQEVCVNYPVLFTDKSAYNPTEWLWQVEPATYSFANGTDMTSKNPQILFLKDGTYTVKLKSTNKYGSDELIQKKYIIARSLLDVQFLKAKSDSVICGCNLISFPFSAAGAVSYEFKTTNQKDIETKVNGNTVLLSLKQSVNTNQSFDSWLKVTGTNGYCSGSDSILLHIIIQPNDSINYATRLFLGRNSGFSNHCATVQVNEPYPQSSGCLVSKSWCPDFKLNRNLLDNSVWFTLIAPSSGMLTINTAGFDNQIALYEASTYQDILSGDRSRYTMMAANDNRSNTDKTASLPNLSLDPGKKYWLQVDGNNAAYGNFTIDLLGNSLEAEVYPNPSKGIFNLNLFHPDKGLAEVSVTNLQGMRVLAKQFQFSLNSYHFTFDLLNQPKGIYFLKVELNGEVLSKKIVYL